MTRYWHDPESPQLDEREQRHAYLIHHELEATKRCWACGTVKPVAAFPGYGVLTCRVCNAVSREAAV